MVDSFLYDEDDVDMLCDSGQFSRNYCKDCGSQNTAPLSKFLTCFLGCVVLVYNFMCVCDVLKPFKTVQRLVLQFFILQFFNLRYFSLFKLLIATNLKSGCIMFFQKIIL